MSKVIILQRQLNAETKRRLDGGDDYTWPMGGRFLSLPRVARIAASFGVGLEASAVCEACASGPDSGGKTPVFVIVVNCSSGWFFTGLPDARVAARAGSVAAGGDEDGNSSACFCSNKHTRNREINHSQR